MATTASAMDLNTKKKLEEYAEQVAPKLYISYACRNDNRFVFGEILHELAYSAFATNQWERDLVDMYIEGEEVEWLSAINHVKQNREDKDVVAGCNQINSQANEIIETVNNN